MKVTKSRLKQLIKEELQKVLLEKDQSMPGGISDDRVYGMSTGAEGADVTADLKGLTARQTLRKLSKLYGGVKGIRKLDRNDPDRIAYRKAYKQLRGSKSNRAMAKKDKVRPINLPEPKLSVQAAEKDYVPVGVSDPQDSTVAAGRGKTQKSIDFGKSPNLAKLASRTPMSLSQDVADLGDYLDVGTPGDKKKKRALAEPSADPR